MSKPDASTAHRLRRIASTLRTYVMPGSVSDLMGMELLEIADALEQQLQVQPVQRFRPAGDAAPEVVLAADYDALLARFNIVAADLAELTKREPQ